MLNRDKIIEVGESVFYVIFMSTCLVLLTCAGACVLKATLNYIAK